jgi:hypothetical protein
LGHCGTFTNAIHRPLRDILPAMNPIDLNASLASKRNEIFREPPERDAKNCPIWRNRTVLQSEQNYNTKPPKKKEK